MGTLPKANPDARELVTEILEETLWWKTLELIVQSLRTKAVNNMRIELGFILDRDVARQRQGLDQIVKLADLENFIKEGIADGAIEWNGSSDFLFRPVEIELAFMLCNDADLHFASVEPSLLSEMGHVLRANGIKVYDSGRLI
jgi:hypothetical protein